MFDLTILGAPVSWKRKRVGINRAVPRKERAWMESAIFQLRSQWGKPPLYGDVECWFAVYLGKDQRMDCINAAQGACDALERAGVVANDKQIKAGHWQEERDRDRPRIEIGIRAIEQEG